MDLGFLRSPNGDKSIKRLMGCILISISIIVGLFLTITSLFFGVKETETALKVLEWLLFSGSALLGAGVVDGLSNALKQWKK